MAVVARIGCAELHREIRPRYAEAVIVSRVDHHVGTDRHVARRAGEQWLRRFVMVMRGDRVLVWRMALQARAVARDTQLAAVRLVTIAASYAGREHLALLERAVIVDLVEHLAIGLIESTAERRSGRSPRRNSCARPSSGIRRT